VPFDRRSKLKRSNTLALRSVFGLVGGLAFVACPRRWRFGVARRLARGLQSLVRAADRYGFPRRRWPRLDGYQELSLQYTLQGLDRLGIQFDPALTVHGADAIPAGGVLIATAHLFLNHLFIRWLVEQGRQVSIVMAQPPERPQLLGARASVDVIKSDATVFFRIRQRIAAGRVVVIALDGRTETAGWRRVETPVGPRFVSDALMRFAERSGIPMLFAITRIARDGGIVTNIVRPSSNRTGVVLDEYCRFLRTQAEQVAH
jgi:hypothetical protein